MSCQPCVGISVHRVKSTARSSTCRDIYIQIVLGNRLWKCSTYWHSGLSIDCWLSLASIYIKSDSQIMIVPCTLGAPKALSLQAKLSTNCLDQRAMSKDGLRRGIRVQIQKQLQKQHYFNWCQMMPSVYKFKMVLRIFCLGSLYDILWYHIYASTVSLLYCFITSWKLAVIKWQGPWCAMSMGRTSQS